MGVDVLTTHPTFAEVLRKGREEVAARLEEKGDGEVFRVWHFWEVEPGETYDPETKGGAGELVCPVSMGGVGGVAFRRLAARERAAREVLEDSAQDV